MEVITLSFMEFAKGQVQSWVPPFLIESQRRETGTLWGREEVKGERRQKER